MGEELTKAGCVCGWTVEGPEDEVVDAVIDHGRTNPQHGGDPRRRARPDPCAAGRRRAVRLMRIVVTGGSGKAGRWVVRDLRDHGHEVRNIDVVGDGAPHGSTLLTDLTDLGQALDALSGFDAVVHLAAIPAPELRPAGETFRSNALSTYHVFAAAELHRMQRVVWASSETVLGVPFETPPAFAPIDEIDRAAARDVVRTFEARRGDDGRAVRAADRDPVRRSADLEHHGATRLRAFPVVLGRPDASEMEPLGLRRRARRGSGGAARTRGGRHDRRDLHRRRGGHGDDAAIGLTDGGGISVRSAPA